MKRIFIILTAVILAVSCTPKGETFIAKGTIADSLITNPGAKIIIRDEITNESDTILLTNGTFEYKGEANVGAIKRIVFSTDALQRSPYMAMFIPEKGIINIDLENQKATGTPLNDALSVFNDEQQVIYDEYIEQRDELVNQFKDEELQTQIDKLGDVAQAKLNALMEETFASNKQNALGLLLFQNMMYDYENVAHFDEALADAADFIKNNKRIVGQRESLLALEQTAEGSMFVDFSGKTPDGADIKLSDFVGKGQYVLVDFWASWCGPCKAEIPVIKEVYDKYSKKGLVVLGVAVWDGDNSKSKTTMKDMGMEWSQIFVGEDKTPTTLYGISSIPHIILFGPDGTIVKRKLRGDNLKKAVADVMK